MRNRGRSGNGRSCVRLYEEQQTMGPKACLAIIAASVGVLILGQHHEKIAPALPEKAQTNLHVTVILDDRTFDDKFTVENRTGESYADCTIQVGWPGEPRTQLAEGTIFEWPEKITFAARDTAVVPLFRLSPGTLAVENCAKAALPANGGECDYWPMLVIVCAAA